MPRRGCGELGFDQWRLARVRTDERKRSLEAPRPPDFGGARKKGPRLGTRPGEDAGRKEPGEEGRRQQSTCRTFQARASVRLCARLLCWLDKAALFAAHESDRGN